MNAGDGTRGEPGQTPGEAYRLLESRHAVARDEARDASLRLSTARVVTFLAIATALLLWDVWEGAAARGALLAGVAFSVVFVVEVVAHARVRRRERWHEALRDLAREGLLRLRRAWAELAEALPEGEKAFEDPEGGHPYARDLDLTGDASLVRLVGPVTSERGRMTLLRWLLGADGAGREAFGPAVIRGRQEAVAELASARELRHTVAAHGRLSAPPEPAETDPFLAWAESPPWLLDRIGVRVASFVLPAALVALAVGDLFFGLPPFWLIPAAGQAEVLRRVWSRIRAELTVVEAGGTPLRAYVAQLTLLEEQAWSATRLRALGDAWGRGPDAASKRLHVLARLLDTVESRRNVVYATLAPVLLLDVHLAVALDRWRARSGSATRAWLDALGEWEALSALAALAHDHPDWCFPELLDGAGGDRSHGADGAVLPAEALLRGAGVGHPLLPPERCVRNDVEVGPPGTFLLVTGSNMSGKSTLLRALGANAVLAGAGAPVCAASFALPPLRVRTSMRIDDSLAEGVSLFMAELLRIRGIVEAAGEPGPPVLYLLDEILHGTNTAERRVAARAVIRHLVSAGAIGAVSTHDLTLAQAPDLEKTAVPVHFRERVEREGEGTRMTFDYTLRPGIATTRNALKLLEAVGLGDLDGLEDEATE